MLVIDKIFNKVTKGDRVLTLTDVTWSDYEGLSTSECDRFLISYLNNQITIMSPGINHERIAEIINLLIVAYCEQENIPCYLFGSTRLKKNDVVGKEPDKGYSFYEDKKLPDLAVEINFTSGSVADLDKYLLLKVNEVWMYQNDKIRFFVLLEDQYKEISTSFYFEKITTDLLIKCISQAFSKDTNKIKQDFLKCIK